MNNTPSQNTADEPFRITISPPATISSLMQDLRIHTPSRRESPLWKHTMRLVWTAVLSSGFHMVMLYRIGAFVHRCRLRLLCILIEKIIYHWYGCIIPCSVKIGPGLWVPHPLGIVLNSRAKLGKYIWLHQHVEIVDIRKVDEGRSGMVGDRVQLNSGAMLIRGAIVGEDSIVAARAVVTRPVPPRSVAIGSPAKPRPVRPDELKCCRSRDPNAPSCTDLVNHTGRTLP